MSTPEFLRYLRRPAPNDNERRSNANVNSENPMGAMLGYGAALSKREFLKDIPERFALAHNNGYIHIHDLDFYDLTSTCCQISIDKLFERGFGNMRPPKRIQSAFMQLCIAIQSNQNDQYGGQSIIDYDIGLTKVIVAVNKRRYEKMIEGCDTVSEELYIDTMQAASKITIEEIEQGCESMIHNLNTLNSRAGAQVPFSSINYGLGPAYFAAIGDEEGEYWAQILLEATFKATMRGLANGETARYPIQIYRVKDGVNAKPGDLYYDLTLKALACTSKRAYPNYLFIDNAGNDVGFDIAKPETHVGTMGCRTRVFANLFGENTSYGRGNASFCTVNLPRLGIMSKTKQEFFGRLSYTINLAADQLQYRLTRQSKRRPAAYPSLVGDEIGINAKACKKSNDLWPMLKHFTVSIGFIGLHECLVALKRKGIELTKMDILKYFESKINHYKTTRKLNYSLLATPAEGLCERFLKIDQKRFGVIPGVTDKEYYTNSFHVPVSQEMNAFDKLKEEGKYHAICNAGHISYVELDGDASQNLEAMYELLDAMRGYGIGYGAYNVPLDHCEECHHDGYIPDDVCPSCGSSNILRMRRITGYLAYLERFNDGKRAEEKDRVKHATKRDYGAAYFDHN